MTLSRELREREIEREQEFIDYIHLFFCVFGRLEICTLKVPQIE